MPGEFTFLILSAITISCVHTVSGPDHYVPFIALSKSRKWSANRTIFWTVVCGIGHVGSSIVLGLTGIAFGWSIAGITWLENARADISGWVMLLAGITYTIYAFVQLKRNKFHKHFDNYEDGNIYVYEHRHGTMAYPRQRKKVTPWVMFIVFVLGPCEPLIPLLSFPAAQHSVFGITILIALFTLFTLLTMVTMVLLGYYGISFFKTKRLEKYMNVLAGLTIMLCGSGILFMGW
jgi:sulfite exporter TauE/SafE